ncbi:ubiquitin carboxyl-terminal hydrolase 10-like [Coccinella septempunctata]|uniref:ubiquitin carboxyl-terminal hydrolase 10-like n=1 Tax=Coccinella septempunctata TaxID=41139 RepID=UPI001D08C192|nr:ubiquitin carboxyl-terminal hydrolase 10-like [Coccinella septempunctata]
MYVLNKKKRGSFDFSRGDSIEASSIYTILNGTRSGSFLVEGRQEDAEEFLGLLLNGLNDEMMNILNEQITKLNKASPTIEMTKKTSPKHTQGML